MTMKIPRSFRSVLVWLSSLLTVSLIGNVVILIHALEECQEQQETKMDAGFIPGQSNEDFLQRITMQRQKKGNNGDNTNGMNDAKDPFDFTRFFDGSAHNTESESFLNIAKFFQSTDGDRDNLPRDTNEEFLTNIFLKTGAEERKEGFFDTLKVFSNAFDEVKKHWDDTFGKIDIREKIDLLQFLFFMDHEEATKNPVWKRRIHRHYRSMTTEEAEALHPGLFLSQLSYTKSCQEVDKFSQQLGGGIWTMRNCTMESKPYNPAHFLLVHKMYNDIPDLGILDFLNYPFRSDVLQVALIIRGTKTIGDMITDSVLKATDYRGGKVHDGILRAARWVTEMYQDDLKGLLEASGKKKMKLWLVGHSLGAGTASLAAIEFIECCSAWMDAEALGFGTPALLSPDLSYKYRDAITTVVTDADCVPRMSGTTMVNALHRIAQHDFGDDLLLEYDIFTRVMLSQLSVGQNLATNLVRDLREWITQLLENHLRPTIAKIRDSNLTLYEPELVPPGECLHIYRDGTAWQGTYVNCTFFNELDIAWHAVDDHMIPTGYHASLLEFIRRKKQNVSWIFENDLMQIPV